MSKLKDQDVIEALGELTRLVDIIVKGSLRRIAEDESMHPDFAALAPAVVSSKAAAAYLGVSTQTLGRMRKKGLIQRVEIAGATRYTRKELDRFIAEREKEARKTS